MGASITTTARRLPFLAVLLWLCAATLAQAHTRTASITLPRLVETASLTLRLEEAAAHWNGPSLQAMAHLSLEPRIGIFAGGDPINYFDPDGRFGKKAAGVTFDAFTTVLAGLFTPQPAPFGYVSPAEQRMYDNMSRNIQNSVGHPFQDMGFYEPNSGAAAFRDVAATGLEMYGLAKAGKQMVSLPGFTPIGAPETQWGSPLYPPMVGNVRSVTPLDVAAQAAAWQGNKDYPGVDKWRNGILQPGEVVLSGAPGESPFYMSVDALVKSGGNQSALWEGLQVMQNMERFPQWGGYRPGVTAFVVTAPTGSANSQALANTQYGIGTFEQYYIPNRENLVPWVSVPLKRTQQ